MQKYQPSKINGFVLQKSQVTEWLENFKNAPLAERQQIPGLEPKRADIIIAGTAILLASMEELRASKVVVSDAGFREGIVVALFNKLASNK